MRGTNRDATDPTAPGAYTLSLSNHQGWQEVDYVTTQFNLFWDTAFAGLDHRFVFGFEYTDESVDNGVFNMDYTNPSNRRRGFALNRKVETDAINIIL
jgi:Outer membrane receptor for monomeric catechols